MGQTGVGLPLHQLQHRVDDYHGSPGRRIALHSSTDTQKRMQVQALKWGNNHHRRPGSFSWSQPAATTLEYMTHDKQTVRFLTSSTLVTLLVQSRHRGRTSAPGGVELKLRINGPDIFKYVKEKHYYDSSDSPLKIKNDITMKYLK